MTRPVPGAAACRYIPTLIAGALTVAAFAPLFWYPLMPAGLGYLFWRCAGTPVRRAALHGWVFGVGMFGAGVHWVYVSCFRYGNMGMAAAATATLLLILYLACYPAIAMAILARLGKGRWALISIAPAAWVLAEWLRSWMLTGFPWLAAGYVMTEGPLAGYGPLVGVPGLSLLTAAAAGLVALALRPGLQRWLALGLIAVLCAGGGLLRLVAWSAPVGQRIDVALVQGNIAQLMKWDPDHVTATLLRYEALSAPHWGADLMVWPENALPLFFDRLPQDWVARVNDRIHANGTTLLTGIPDRADASGAYFNAIVDFAEPQRAYHKRHLVPFGEYVPLRASLGPLLDLLKVPMSNFSRGAAYQTPLQVRDHPIASAICYEIVFEREVRRALPSAHLLLTVSNDTWFGDTLAPHQHLQMARMRALELRRPLLRATNSGITAVADPYGREVARIPLFQSGVLHAVVTPQSGATPYAVTGDWPVAVWVSVVLALALVRSRRPARQL